MRGLSASSKCPHINQKDNLATINLYDLGSVKDYLDRIKFPEGDVIDAFSHEFVNYERPGYWNEKKVCLKDFELRI